MDPCGISVDRTQACARIKDRFGRPFRLRRQGRSSRARRCPTAFASIRLRCEAILMEPCGIRVVHARLCARIKDRFGPILGRCPRLGSSRARLRPTEFASIRLRCEAIPLEPCGIRVVHARLCARIKDRFGPTLGRCPQHGSSRARLRPTAFASVLPERWRRERREPSHPGSARSDPVGSVCDPCCPRTALRTN